MLNARRVQTFNGTCESQRLTSCNLHQLQKEINGFFCPVELECDSELQERCQLNPGDHKDLQKCPARDSFDDMSCSGACAEFAPQSTNRYQDSWHGEAVPQLYVGMPVEGPLPVNMGDNRSIYLNLGCACRDRCKCTPEEFSKLLTFSSPKCDCDQAACDELTHLPPGIVGMNPLTGVRTSVWAR